MNTSIEDIFKKSKANKTKKTFSGPNLKTQDRKLSFLTLKPFEYNEYLSMSHREWAN